MPKGSGDIKRFQKQEKRRQRNRSVRSAVKTYIGKARQAIVAMPESEDTSAAIVKAISELDRAARKGAIHPNNAARRKSRLVKRQRAAVAAGAA